MTPNEVWVAVADIGLNGFEMLGVWTHPPTPAELDALVSAGKPSIKQSTGYSGWSLNRMPVATRPQEPQP